MSLKGNAGLKWVPPGGTETTHALQHPLRLEAAPSLRRRRVSVQPWDFSAAPTVFESSGSARELRVRHRFEDFPRRLLRVLDDAAGGVQIDYYPDLDHATVFPLVLIEDGESLSLGPDSDRFGYGEYETPLLLRSVDSTPLWPLYTAIAFNGAGGGTPTVDGAGQTGDSLATTGWPISTTGVVLAGDVLRLGPEADTNFVRAASDVDSDASGNATIPLTIEIGADNEPANGAAIATSHPMFD